jgi:hypothetical protein
MTKGDDFVRAFEPALNSAYAGPHAKAQTEALVTKPRQCEPTKRSPLPSAREVDAAIERKYGCRPYRE